MYVDDVAAGIVAAVDRGRIGESYFLGRPERPLRDAMQSRRGSVAGAGRGSRSRRVLRVGSHAPAAFARAAGLPDDLREVARSSLGVTYWASSAKAATELGYRPARPRQRAARDVRRRLTGATTDYTPGMARELPIFEPPPAGEASPRIARQLPISIGGGLAGLPAADGSVAQRRHPDWIRARMPSGDNFHDLKGLLRGLDLNTVCEEARCPNIGECWDQRTATIMILGDTCTRACGFCAVKTGRPTWFDDDEPRRVAEAVAQIGLEHVVVTSVARDDLPGRRLAGSSPRRSARCASRAPGWASRSSSRTSTAPTTGCAR